MVTAAHRSMFAAAGRELAASSIELEGSVNIMRRLPWILGRATTLRDLDAGLDAATSHARAALRHLDGVSLEPGSGEEAVAQVREAVGTYVALLEQRRALPTGAARFYDTTVERGVRRLPEHVAEGLVAIGEGRALAWATRPIEMTERDPRAAIAARRMLAPVEPDVADRVVPFLSDEPFSWDPSVRRQVDALVADPSVARHDLPGQALWAIAQGAFNHGQVRLPASDLGRIVDDVIARQRSPLRSLHRPVWIDATVDDASMLLDPARAADLAIMRHSGSPKHVDLFVAQALMSDTADRFRGADFRGEIAAAARRLPDGFGSRVPTGIERDPIALEAWSRRVRTSYARSIADRQQPSAQLVQTLLDPAVDAGLGNTVGGALVARELLERIDGGDTMRRAVGNVLRDRLDAFIASSERSWHIDYGELGRVRSAAALLARIDERIAAPPAQPAANGSGHLAW